jgi:hypothetical protein
MRRKNNMCTGDFDFKKLKKPLGRPKRSWKENK